MTKVKWNKELVNKINTLRNVEQLKYREIAEIMSRITNAKLDKDIVRLAVTNHPQWIGEGEPKTTTDSVIDTTQPIALILKKWTIFIQSVK